MALRARKVSGAFEKQPPGLYHIIRVFNKNTTATATGTSLNKTYNEQNNVHVRYNSWYISLPSSAQQLVVVTLNVK